MTNGTGRFRAALYALFTLSGFAGLIYESIWTHYLKLFLGHAAYAQTLVLSIFMGGMALGAWLAGERSRRISRPLVAYAIVEAVLGLFALLFDPLFRGLEGWAFDHAIPVLQSPLAIDALKWGMSAAVILPQSVLLGTTFPLMSAGIVRVTAGAPGRVLAWLYFTNSIGAAIGVLVSGFVLIAAVGLPGTILTAGLINFALVLALWLLLRRKQDVSASAPPIGPPTGKVSATMPETAGLAKLLLTASLLTGAASFFYEVGWIRMLSLVLGSATHSFEFMLSAFIAGLALGSFLLRGRIGALQHPLRFLGVVQVVMGTLALMTLVLYGQTFDWMSGFLKTVQRNESGYILYNLFSHGICLALMLPVTICAGMTLPLITSLLLRAGYGEASIGRVYASNTVGAIAGILLAVHVVMPTFGLRQVVVAGALVDLGLGLWILWGAREAVARVGRAALGGALALCALVVLRVHFDPSRLASGVFRTGLAHVDAPVLFHRDGKTASIDVFQIQGLRLIATNGKIDAGLRMDGAGDPSPDDLTMILLALLPALTHASLKDVAVIGFGSGRTTHALLQASSVRSVETIEIEAAMVAGARSFGGLVAAAYDDPRSRLHIEDAKTFFSRGTRRYDAIISEPSNPWVSGVASLFSHEFYRQARRHLNDDGLLIQWLQLYEFDLSLAASILKALGTEFADYVIYEAGSADVVIVASATAPVPEPAWNGTAVDGLGGLMAPLRIQGLQDLRALRVADRAVLEPFLNEIPAPTNSDYFPFVDQQAAKHRFLNSRAMELVELRAVAGRLLQRPGFDGLPPVSLTRATGALHEAQTVGRAYSRSGEPGLEELGEAGRTLLTFKAFDQVCAAPVAGHWLGEFQRAASRLLPYTTPADARNIAGALRQSSCYRKLPPEIHSWIDFFEADGSGDWARVRSIGRELLADRQPEDAITQFLLAEVLLADLKSGRLEQAITSLPELRTWVTQSAAVRLLMAHVAAAARRTPQ